MVSSSSSEDFSFPKITNIRLPPPHYSPSLWRVSSVVYPDLNWDDDHHTADGCGGGGGQVVVAEEKMDMLWEDFNEELQRVSSLGGNNNKKKNKKKMMMKMKNCHSIAGCDYYDEQKLQLSDSVELVKSDARHDSRSPTTKTNKKQSLGSMFKLVKKMFLLNKSKRI